MTSPDAAISPPRLLAAPPFAILVLLLAALGLTVALIVVPPRALYRHGAPTAYAEQTLRESYGVEPAAHGDCLGTPTFTWAWQEVARAPDATARFERILAHARPAGRVYALAGLQRVAPAQFLQAVQAFDTSMVVVKWRPVGQYWQERRLADIVRQDLRPGRLAESLAAAPIVAPTCEE